MTLQQIIERVNSKKVGLIRIYVDDALRELEGLIPEKTTHTKYDIVVDQKLYSMPGNMVRLLGVYRKWSTDSSHYVKMSRATHINITEDAGSTSVDGGQDIIVI